MTVVPTCAKVQGVFTRSLSSYGGDRRSAADAVGYKAVAIQLVNTPQAAANVAELARCRNEFRARGWLVGGWGTFGQDTTEVTEEGRDARNLFESLTLDFWSPDGEAWVEGTANKWKSQAWMDGWMNGRSTHPPLLLSCLSSTTPNYPRDMDYKPWLTYPDCAISPQVYTASDPAYTMTNMVGTMRKAGVPRAVEIPTFNVVKGQPVPVQYAIWRRLRWLYAGEDCLPGQFAKTVPA